MRLPNVFEFMIPKENYAGVGFEILGHGRWQIADGENGYLPRRQPHQLRQFNSHKVKNTCGNLRVYGLRRSAANTPSTAG